MTSGRRRIDVSGWQPLTKYDAYAQVAHAYLYRQLCAHFLRDAVSGNPRRGACSLDPGALQLTYPLVTATLLDSITDGKGEYIMVNCIPA